MSTKSPGQQVHEIDWLTPLTRQVLLLAQQEAAQAGGMYIQPEHLLLGVMMQGESKAATLLNRSGLDVATLRAHIEGAYPGNTPSNETTPPLSQAAEGGIEQAIAMITYYLTRHRPLAKVTPEHLVLSIISHPGIQKLLVTHPAAIASLRRQLTEDMEPDFLHHIEGLFLLPDHMRSARRKTMNLARRNKGHAKKLSPAPSFIFCPSCQQQIQPHWKHCAYCGNEVARKCARCGTLFPNGRGAKFCFGCGSPLA
jgi:ATP-dependent Clp protease ATP-binding subunit ClpA